MLAPSRLPQPQPGAPRLAQLELRSSCLRSVCALLLFGSFVSNIAPAEPAQKPPPFPFPEKLSYRVEWRLITAGNVTVQLSHVNAGDWQLNMDVQSAGLVTRLYKVDDKYKVRTDQKFCGVKANFDAAEGKRHKIESMSFDGSHKLQYEDHDLLNNTSEKKTLDVPPCTYEIAGALAWLRTLDLPPGKSATFPITDGKRVAYAKITSQVKESVNIDGKYYAAVRYEAFLFDNVLYRRKGRLFIWLTDDAARIPVMIQIHLGFPVGRVTVELEKQQQL
jgi:Protein of unknown function (DUF3108)